MTLYLQMFKYSDGVAEPYSIVKHTFPVKKLRWYSSECAKKLVSMSYTIKSDPGSSDVSIKLQAMDAVSIKRGTDISKAEIKNKSTIVTTIENGLKKKITDGDKLLSAKLVTKAEQKYHEAKVLLNEKVPSSYKNDFLTYNQIINERISSISVFSVEGNHIPHPG